MNFDNILNNFFSFKVYKLSSCLSSTFPLAYSSSHRVQPNLHQAIVQLGQAAGPAKPKERERERTWPTWYVQVREQHPKVGSAVRVRDSKQRFQGVPMKSFPLDVHSTRCVCALANNAFCLMINCNAILGGHCFPQTCKHTHNYTRCVQLWNVCRESRRRLRRIYYLWHKAINSFLNSNWKRKWSNNWTTRGIEVGAGAWTGLGLGWVQARWCGCRASLGWAKPFKIVRKNAIWCFRFYGQ